MATPHFSKPAFVFDATEIVINDSYLTPVYFNRQVLTRYLYDSRFICDFASETYGSVQGPGVDISFGINKNGSVLVWIGDLQSKLSPREQCYWLIENIDSEHDTASEFFDAQIGAEFTDRPFVIRCLSNLSKFNASFHKIYSVHLYHDRSIDERIEECNRYKRIILNNVDDFKRFISELNEIINEVTNNVEIRKLLSGRNIQVVPGTKGNKLLQSVYESILGDTENLIGPFFSLYDLRLWADHSMGNTALNTFAQKAGVSPNDYQKLLESLVNAMNESSIKLCKLVDRD